MKMIGGMTVHVAPNGVFNEVNWNQAYKELSNKLSLKRTSDEEKKEAQEKLDELEKIPHTDSYQVTVLMDGKSDEGFKNIGFIFGNEDIVGGKYVSDVKNIEEHKDGLIFLGGGVDGLEMWHIQNGNIEAAGKCIQHNKDVYGDNYYIQFNYHGNSDGEFDDFKTLIELAHKNGVKLVAANSCRYIKESDRLDSRFYLSINNSQDFIPDEGSDDFSMCSEEELSKRFKGAGFSLSDIEESFNSIHEIEDKVDSFEFPQCRALANAEEDLWKRIWEGFDNIRKGTELEEESRKRIETEWEVIKSKNFTMYFIKVLRLTHVAKQLGILVGAGRGSGCGSEVNFLVGITFVDPLKYGLLFERFLSPSRHGWPDIDEDFSTASVGQWAHGSCETNYCYHPMLDDPKNAALRDKLWN
jgi:DNA polymerase-3 subunit alpha